MGGKEQKGFCHTCSEGAEPDGAASSSFRLAAHLRRQLITVSKRASTGRVTVCIKSFAGETCDDSLVP